ncbi:hypothetical protein LshimejAT787_0505900 [Lyophyllum shimeji]|uniref:DUF6699 domain-containing protein n=1 Tax=Lyophyllum shimeji TaxID=47721 RepID=A0A9P3UP85_LYOSH|nr:hypothetical protein LshimejAT787_0505900 [Lyophyllum shimeji]
MFKWSKRRPSGEPSTPKLSSVSLPNESPVISRAQWTADLVPQPSSAFVSTLPEYRSKSRHSGISGAPPTSHVTTRTTEIKTSSTVHQVKEKKAYKPAAQDIEAGYLSSPADYMTKDKASLKTKAPIKGILKPPKPFMEQDFNKPVIPLPPHSNKGGPFKIDEVGRAGSNTTGMQGGRNSHRSTSEKLAENTSQSAAQSRYKPLAPAVPPGAFVGPMPVTAPVYAPVIPPTGPYYTTAPQSAIPHPSGPFAAPQNPTQAPPLHHRRSSRYGGDRGGGVSDTEGLPRATRPSRGDGGLSDTEGLSRTHSSRYGGVAPNELQNALHQVAQQQSTHSGRRRATHPIYQENNGVSPTSRYQGAEDYARPRNHSFSAYSTPGYTTAPGPPRPAPATYYVRPHIVTRVPQKEEAIAISWPLIEPCKRKRLRPPRPPLFFDIAFNPTEHDPRFGIRALTEVGYTRPLTREEMDTPASSHCVLQEMIIQCDEPELQRWNAVARRAEGLRCIDVFQAIHDTYNVPLTPAEIDELRDYLPFCRPAFLQRCRDAPGLELQHQLRGMCRVDLLRTKRLFRGMIRRNGVWMFQVEKPVEARA